MITFYKLRHATDATKECYVGSTNYLPRRKSLHKYDCNNPKQKGYNIRVYQYIRANDGYDSWTYDVLEQKDMSKRERYIREGELKNQHNATLNTLEPGAFSKDNGITSRRKAKHKTYEKYKEINKERTHEISKLRADTDNICDKCGMSYRGLGHKPRHLRTKKCQRLAQQRIQPVINIDGDNNNVTVNITVNL